MNWKGNRQQLPASPFYLENDKPLSNAHKVAISGNLFHKWQILELPDSKVDYSDTNQFEKEQVPSSSFQNTWPLKTAPKKPTSHLPDIELLRAAATIDQVLDAISFEPKIENQQVNWVQDWNDSTYSDIGIEEENREFKRGDTLFEQILPKDNEKPHAIEPDNMKESKFLRWLKDKEARRQGYQTQKADNKADNKAKVASETEKKEGIENINKEIPKKKLSKKKKKKELNKILKKSLKMEDEIVSETLANIMVQQGHIGKAIEMYQRLSLIFPEKSSYFADIIDKLEEE